MPTIPTIPGFGGITVINGIRGYKEFIEYCNSLRGSGWVPNPLSKPGAKMTTHKTVQIGDFTVHLYIYMYSKYNYVTNTVTSSYSFESAYYEEGIKEKLGGERFTLGS